PKNQATDNTNFPEFKNSGSAEYVKLLAHPNQWWRLQAQRLLLQEQDTTVIPAVQSMFEENEDPRARVHALYVLEGMEALNESIINKAIKDPHPGVRKHGIILSERFPECLPQLLESIND